MLFVILKASLCYKIFVFKSSEKLFSSYIWLLEYFKSNGHQCENKNMAKYSRFSRTLWCTYYWYIGIPVCKILHMCIRNCGLHKVVHRHRSQTVIAYSAFSLSISQKPIYPPWLGKIRTGQILEKVLGPNSGTMHRNPHPFLGMKYPDLSLKYSSSTPQPHYPGS